MNYIEFLNKWVMLQHSMVPVGMFWYYVKVIIKNLLKNTVGDLLVYNNIMLKDLSLFIKKMFIKNFC